jgi:hypothetical protein
MPVVDPKQIFIRFQIRTLYLTVVPLISACFFPIMIEFFKAAIFVQLLPVPGSFE